MARQDEHPGIFMALPLRVKGALMVSQFELVFANHERSERATAAQLLRGNGLMHARVWLRCLSVLGVLLIVTCPAAGEERAPKLNFVFILIDDMGWKDLGCYGSTFHETPNIDRLAGQGMRFTDAYAAGPVCSPTRASILTGKYPARLHLTDFLTGRSDRPSQKLLRPKFRQYLSLDERTIAKELKARGYVSASIGKWHLGGEAYSPVKHGFDVNVGGTITGSPPGGHFRFRTPTLSARDDQEYLTDRLTEEAEKFMDENKERPFFIYLAHYAVHIPLEAKEQLVAKYQAKAKPSDGQTNALYAAMVESVDDSVDRILKKLEQLRIADRTVVFFTSDNGGLSVKEGPNTPATSNAPLRAGKGFLYEGGIREPLIVKWPGVTPPGSVCGIPVCSIDFFPTILQMTGGTADSTLVDGISLVPFLKQTGEWKREALYWHYPHYSNQGGRPSGAVRERDFKLIEFFENGKLELYNLRDDIGEKRDLAAMLPAKTETLHAMLKTWRRSVSAQMPTPNPAYRSTRGE
jgi:arylsulfatase A-like enzyme